MYNGIQKIEEIINDIENNITSEIDCEALASRMALSVYEFRRIFAFIVGCPLSEYIRKRRLSLAALELMRNRNISISEVGERYRYSTLAAFSKAFSDYHGISPSACQRGDGEIKLFSKPKFELRVENAGEHPFTILNDSAFTIKGYSGISDYTDTECCEGVWSEFYDAGHDAALSSDVIFVSYENDAEKVKCTIGERAPISAGDAVIPECRFLCVKMNTTDDAEVNKKYNSLLTDVIPSAKLKRREGIPTVEVYPRDMSEDSFEGEIRIPIENIE